MAKDKLKDLNQILFCELERLNDEDLSGKELAEEVSRAKAIAAVSGKVLDIAKTTINAMKLVSSGNYSANSLPETFGITSGGAE